MSPAIAASATLALNTAECFRLVLFAIFCSIFMPRWGINMEQIFHLAACSNFRDHFSAGQATLLPINGLPLDVDQIGQHLVGGGDDLGVGLETALGGNQLDKLSTEIHVGLFQRVW